MLPLIWGGSLFGVLLQTLGCVVSLAKNGRQLPAFIRGVWADIVAHGVASYKEGQEYAEGQSLKGTRALEKPIDEWSDMEGQTAMILYHRQQNWSEASGNYLFQPMISTPECKVSQPSSRIPVSETSLRVPLSLLLS